MKNLELEVYKIGKYSVCVKCTHIADHLRGSLNMEDEDTGWEITSDDNPGLSEWELNVCGSLQKYDDDEVCHTFDTPGERDDFINAIKRLLVKINSECTVDNSVLQLERVI